MFFQRRLRATSALLTAAVIFAAALAACGPYNHHGSYVVPTETAVAFVLPNPPLGAKPVTEAFIGEVDVQALSAQLVLQGVYVTTSRPVPSIRLASQDGFVAVAMPSGTSQMLFQIQDQLAPILSFLNAGEHKRFSLYADLTGADGQTIIFSIPQVTISSLTYPYPHDIPITTASIRTTVQSESDTGPVTTSAQTQ